MAATAATDRIAAVRAFTRFYTNLTGVLRRDYLGTPYSVTEARVLFELAQAQQLEAGELRRTLEIDGGYLSRILARFESDGLVARQRSESDRRRQQIRLLPRGRAAFSVLDERSRDETRELLAPLTEDERQRVVAAMDTVRSVIERRRDGDVALRPPTSGDYGWVVERHGVLYREEYGWDERFEALVARIVADFVEQHDPIRERAWIAEVDGERAGCVFCVAKDEQAAQLRILLVEPHARGRGVGTRLVGECIEFARRAGYAQMMLWTNDVLVDARRIYERFGFRMVAEGRSEASATSSSDRTGCSTCDQPVAAAARCSP